jgi:hypothetical protein
MRCPRSMPLLDNLEMDGCGVLTRLWPCGMSLAEV